MTEERKNQQFQTLIQRRSVAAEQIVRVLSSRHGDVAKGTIGCIREIGGQVRRLISARSYSLSISHKIGGLLKEYDKYLKGLETSIAGSLIKEARMFSRWLIEIDEKLVKLF